MGTRFEFVLVGEDESHLRAVGEEAIAEILYLHEKFSYFSASSIVTRVNQRAAHEAVDVDRETFELLELCRDVWEQSEGAFDITIAPLMHRYGFRDGLHRRGTVNRFGMEQVEFNESARTIRFVQSGMAIDLGAVAKGYALDRAAAICRENGIACGLLHGGTSTVIAIGSPPDDDRGWGVKIHDEAEPITVYLRDEALSVSAPRGSSVKKDGAIHGHIIDPRNSKPAIGITTAAVICSPSLSGRGQGGGLCNKIDWYASPTPQPPPSREGEHCAALADAWSTALLVLQHRPAGLCDAYASLMRRVDENWEVLPAGCRRAAIDPLIKAHSPNT